MQHRRWTVGAVCVGVALGCTLLAGCGKGSYKTVQVSGKVTLDGNPVPNLIVSFQPVATDKNPNPGPASVGTTNDQGEYELTLINPQKPGKGAVVGKQKVRFTRQAPQSDAKGDVGARMTPNPELDPIVARYQKTPWEIDVPASGTKDMNLELRQK